MRLTRIYQPQALSSGQIISVSKPAVAHLVRVLRLQVGDDFIVFNGSGGEFNAKIIAQNKQAVSAQLGQYEAVNRESPLNITLAQAVLRTDKMDYVLQKAVELGVRRLVPLLTARSTLKLSPERWQKRCLHWQGVILAASEQSGRTRLARLENPMSFDMGLSALKADKRLILLPKAREAHHLAASPPPQSVVVFVGPEGGWSENEAKLAVAEGCSPLRLGPRILRTETAGLVAVSLLQSLLGDIARNIV
jgi:16S rRNA (uracil1498-N3)-methyltransferase